MPGSPQVRFLLRAVGSLVIALALWFLLLMDPLLGGLRVGTEWAMKLMPGDGSAAHASIGQDGDWLLQMPVPAFIGRLDSVQRIFGRVSKDAPLVRVRSLKLPVQRKFPMVFTVSLPFFWALWAAAPAGGNFWRGLLAGSGLLAIIGILSLLIFAVCSALDMLHLTPAGPAGFLLNATYFAAKEVVPYAAPPLLALWLHEGLRDLVFSGQEDPRQQQLEPGNSAPKAARAGRGRYRG